MNKRLLFTGGIINVIFVIFHFWLAWELYQLEGVTPEVKALLLMMDEAGILMIGFAAYASLFCVQQMLSTKLGKATMIFVILIYSTRALEEIVLAPQFSAVIFITCLLTTIVYLLAMLLPQQK